MTVKLFNGSAWSNWLAVTSVAWEPYGGLRAYELHPSTTPTYTYSDAGVDRLVSVQQSGGSVVTRTYDADGRVRTISWPNDSSGTPTWQQTWTPDSEGSTGRGGNDTVYRAVSVNGSVYGYYYDATNKRRLKQYPAGTTDEYFYDTGTRLLVDRGNATVSSPAYLVTDEYVWLGEVPVVVVRGRLNTTTDARSSDATTACNRNAETVACGARHIVSDALPKPVVVVDNAGRVAALHAWDAFGDVNRVGIRNGDTPHPYANGDGRYLYSFYPGNSGRTTPTGTALDYRFTFDMVDTEGTAATPIDGVVVQTNYVAQGTKVGGYHRGRVTTPWYTSDGGVVTLLFTSDGRNCPPNQCLDGGSPTDGGAFPYAGVGTALVEFRRRQSTATAFSVPLRFPGQYFDAETEVVENWNRFYEPATGRYLSPEPMVQSPANARHMAQSGMSVPIYAYALNNPLRFVDPTGLAAECPGGLWFGAPMFVGDLSIGAAGAIGFLGIYSCLSAAKTVVVASICGFASVPVTLKKMEKHSACGVGFGWADKTPDLAAFEGWTAGAFFSAGIGANITVFLEGHEVNQIDTAGLLVGGGAGFAVGPLSCRTWAREL